MAALGYFKSPTTGNAVTWDGSGTQTDTGIAHGEYQMPGQTGPTVVGPGPGLSPTVAGPQDPGRMYRGNDMYSQSFGPDGQPTVTSKPIEQPTTLAEYNQGSKGPSTDGGVWLSDSSGNRWNMGGSPASSTVQAGPNNGGGSGMGGAAQSMSSTQQIQQQISGLKTQADLNKFFATSGYTAEQLAQAAPQYGGVADYQNAMVKGTQAYGLGPTVVGPGPTQNSGGIIGTNGSGQTQNTSQSSSASTNAGTGPGTWTVTPDQTVESRIGGIINSNSPLMQQARTRALQQQNERGTVNSSMATTAGDSAVYDAAQRIAQPDAGMFGDAAKTNAMAQTSYGISQNNNQTSRDINSANIGAQKELQHSSQLYNNLATQTASANSIQGWGLNTITTIQSSDLSAAAKTAAISSVRQYLADSYKIQGDWHTTAAKTIDAIFK